MKNKEKYLQVLQTRNRGKVKKLREKDSYKLDHVVFCWLISKRDENIPIDGIMIKEKILSYVKELGFEDFHASNGADKNTNPNACFKHTNRKKIPSTHIKLQRLRKICIWTFESLVHQINSL